MTALIEELTELSPEFHMDIFGPFCPNIQVDMEELVVTGHSFGGITAVTTASTLPERMRPKACVAFDPWFFPNQELWRSQELRIPCPVQFINSERWPDEIPLKYLNQW